MVVLNGSDVFRQSIKLPVFNALMTDNHAQYNFAGGAVSPHTRKKHLSLVSADSVGLEWKLSSLSVLNGESLSQWFNNWAGLGVGSVS